MKDKYFLDTNILINSFDSSSPDKIKIAKKITQETLQKQNGCISYQVIQEFLNVSTNKNKPHLKLVDIKKYLTKVLFPLCEVYPTT